MSDRSLAAEVARLRREVAEIRRGQRVAHGASIENAAIEVRDGDGSLRAVVGQQPDGTSGVNVVNGPMPPTPTDPVVTPALGALTVTWGGAFADAPAAPLDWSRVEVHIGPDAAFEPSQGTLRGTIETAQGGAVTVPLPYTEWWAKLRSRTLAGVAGPASDAVAGTPRQAEAPDIAAGAITADSIAVDALTGKTITGGTINGTEINGATVTGGVVRTSATGKRVVVTPNGGFDGTIPATRFYSGKAGEQRPGEIAATLDPEFVGPYLSLTAPSIHTDWMRASTMRLHSGTFDASEVPQWVVSTPLAGHDSKVSISGFAPTAAMPGTGAAVTMDVDATDGTWGYFSVRADGFECDPYTGGTLTYVNGVLTVPSERFGRVTITPAGDGVVTSMLVSGLNLPGTDFYGFASARTTVPGDRKPDDDKRGVTGVACAGETSDGMTVYVNRQNTTATIVNWMIRGV